MSHSYRVSPQSLQTAGPCNIYVQPSTKADCPVMSNGDSRRRYNGTHTHRRDSLLTGLRNLMTRPRSESLNSQMMNRPKKPLLKVQVSGCQLESVYDLREDKGEESDLYDDQWAFRRPRSNSSDFLILRKTSRPLSVDVVGLVDAQSDPYRQYMKVVDCYELAPSAGNIITLDKNIQVDRAFTALCENNVGAGLVWDSELSKVTSIVTLTDFLGLLQTENATSSNKTVSSIMQSDALITISADNKILEACEDFCMNHVHRLVVTEPVSGDVLYLLTIKRILQAIHKQNRSLHFAQWLSCPIKESEVGTWTEKIHTLTSNPEWLEILKKIDIIVSPNANPDGYEYSRTNDRLWRTNRKIIKSGNSSCHGIDINHPYHLNYPGIGPASEEETKALTRAMEKVKDRIKGFVDIHNAGELIMYPWGYATDTFLEYVEELKEVANRMKEAIQKERGTNYTVINSAEYYPADGATDDYAAGLGVKYVYVLELSVSTSYGKTWVTPESWIEPVAKEIINALNVLANQIVNEFAL